MCLSSNKIANAIHIPKARRNPLIIASTSIDHCPEITRINLLNDFEIFTERFEADLAPNVELSFGMAIGFEEFVKSIFMKDAYFYHSTPQQVERHSFQRST